MSGVVGLDVLDGIQDDIDGTLNEDACIRAIVDFANARLFEIDVYRHQNGFIKIPLGVFRQVQVRVHVWDSDAATADSNIHSHRHPATSRIVVGSILEQRWKESEFGVSYRRYGFSPGRPGENELTETGAISLLQVGEFARSAGQTYSIPIDDFHTIQTNGPLTVTVFAQDLRLFQEGVVASGRPVERPRRPRLLTTEDRTGLSSILSTVSASALAGRPLDTL